MRILLVDDDAEILRQQGAQFDPALCTPSRTRSCA